MIGAFDFEAFTVVDAARDIEDHGDVEEVGAGEAEAVVAVCLGEVGVLVFIHRLGSGYWPLVMVEHIF